MTKFSLMLLPALLSIACASDDKAASLETGPGAFAASFETSEDFVTRTSTPGEGLSSSPHGVMRIWYSANIETVLGVERASFQAPEGTVAIKTQGYEGDEYSTILVMVKDSTNDDADSLGWTYEVRNAAGEKTGPDDPSMCSGCHVAFEDNDGLPGLDVMN